MTGVSEQKVHAKKLAVSLVKQIDLFTKNNQLSFGVTEQGHLLTLYFGKKVGQVDLSYVVTELVRASYLADTDNTKNYKVEQLPLTLPTFANTDLNTPALHLLYEDGSRLSNFRYKNHYYSEEKPVLVGLPSTREQAGGTTLILVLEDEQTSVQVEVIIHAHLEEDVFTQSIRVKNMSEQTVHIQRIMSLHFPLLRADLDKITLTGAWGRETQVNRSPLSQGLQGVQSARGASGHGQNPFFCLAEKETDQTHGSVYGFNLIYSGNFIAECEVDMHQNSRVQLGINPFDFSWVLTSGEVFYSPEVVMVYSDQGLNKMSQIFAEFYTNALVPTYHAKKLRPILINNWEATYFDFNKASLIKLAKCAAEVGIELFVLDDGWYGQRSDETSSLGDWFPNEEKLGGAFGELIQEINQLGLDFGLWFEPEMVSKNSHLYRKHPEWVLRTLTNEPQEVRSQLVLDLTRKEVQDYLIQTISELLTHHPIRYVKWDMNRNLTDIYSTALAIEKQTEVAHRYILGLYRVLNELTKNHPTVLFESCAGGGGRFDPGMLAYTNQIWTSDETDAIARLRIQEGNSYVYPSIAMSGHVSAVPNHQIGRITPLATRTAVAQQGNFGYELNLPELSEEELGQIKKDIKIYKKNRETLQLGKHTRLEVLDAANETAWQKTSDTQVIVTHVQILVQPNTVPKRLKLQELQPEKIYVDELGNSYTGNELMYIGLALPKPTHDYFSTVWSLKIEGK
ncbi:alpha-galactosidase [Enterococcus sp. AZ194]|uniref:alpha-galactosidase n=1 Tax=Enterococcus sp. AZ194 TaxID=2774629 RepID=UPI003F24621E